jgi:hypothetical protein
MAMMIIRLAKPSLTPGIGTGKGMSASIYDKIIANEAKIADNANRFVLSP